MLHGRLIKLTRKLWNVCMAIIRGQVTMNPPFVVQFERDFANYIGCQYGITFCNGTSAIEAALFAVGVKKGDEVLVPSYTFHASINPIVNAGAKAVFLDIDEDTLTLDPGAIQRKVNNKTHCILVVHIWGNPANMDRISNMARKYDLKIVEDCSHAHGATWQGKKVGSFGDVGCFSLQGYKPISAGEGGIAVTNNRHFYERLSLYGHFGRIGKELQNSQYNCLLETGVGYKRRVNPLGICMASVDLRYIDKVNKDKRRVARRIEGIINAIDGISCVKSYPGAQKGGFYGGLPVLIERNMSSAVSADELVKELNRLGIEAKKQPYGMYHRFAHLSDLKFRKEILYNMDGRHIEAPNNYTVLPVTESAFDRVFFLPLKECMSEEQLNHLKKVMVKALTGRN